MKTDKITVFDLFETQRRYMVPIFQRGYVWTKDGQWEPLWEDIVEQARLVDAHKNSPKGSLRKHFLGAVVLIQVPTGIREVPASEIIDGQQRLLTLQVMLTAFKDASRELGDEYLTMQLERLTSNPGPYRDDNERYKVWPTNAYREYLEDIMTAGTPEQLSLKYPQRLYRHKLVPLRPALVDAYFFYHEKIGAFLASSDEYSWTSVEGHEMPANRLGLANLLFEALMKCVQLVEIQLDPEDDPQVIFETLNYRGVPLEPSDLIRNFIFLDATRQNKDVNALYEKWWKEYDETGDTASRFWKEKESQGRYKRSRLDLFFFHYLTSRLGREIKIGHLYQEFKDWWGGYSGQRTIEAELEAANGSSKVFRSLLMPDEGQRLGSFAQRLRILDMTTVYPLLLWLCENCGKTTAEDFNGILADLESYVIRRTICRLTSKNYNRVFLALLNKLIKEGRPNRASVQRELLSLNEESSFFPDDDNFRTALISAPLYDSIGPRRVRLVLTALELASRTSRHEPLALPIDNTLTVEHVMPQGFKQEDWPYPERGAGDKEGQELKRRVLLHSLGNLALLTQPLNSAVSNGPFREKRPAIAGQSLLILNSYFQRLSNDDTWGEEAILERGRQLADLAVKVWQYPQDTAKEGTPGSAKIGAA